jgi:hypothetical protein
MTSTPGGSGSLICLFEVPPDADAEFLAGWERAAGAAVLYRALRRDVEFRFVAVGPVSVADIPFPSHPAVYEVVHEEGDVDGRGGTVLINPFDAMADTRDTFAGQPGFLGTRLHRAIDPKAEFRYVEIARWSSPLMVARARTKTAETGQPALYEVVPASPT